MEIGDVVDDLMRMLEFKLLEHLGAGEFNKDNLTRNVMTNLLENLFMKAMYDLKKSNVLAVMPAEQISKKCLENIIHTLHREPEDIQKSFQGYLKQHQNEELFEPASEMSKYLIGALPVLLEEYMVTGGETTI